MTALSVSIEYTLVRERRKAITLAQRRAVNTVCTVLGEVYSMTKTMTHDPGKYDPGKLNDDTDSMTTLNYDVPSLDLVK